MKWHVVMICPKPDCNGQAEGVFEKPFKPNWDPWLEPPYLFCDRCETQMRVKIARSEN